jgi:uncharacterized protein YciI
MSPELPDGVAIESIYLVEVPYLPGAEARRPAFRREHLTRIAALREAGTIIEAGGCTDFSGSYLLVRVPDAEAAAALVASDVYSRNGIWDEARIRGFGRVCRPDEIASGG